MMSVENSRLKKALQGIAQEISQGLRLEMGRQQVAERSTSVSLLDLLLQELVKEVAGQMRNGSQGNGLSDEDLEARSQKVEEKLEKAEKKLKKKLEKLSNRAVDDDDDDDEAQIAGSSFPNLKYAKPKYKNVESILKYIEADEDKGGLKLVIMNFND
jgi:parvulin-like peptidyl-prolyl isomerase